MTKERRVGLGILAAVALIAIFAVAVVLAREANSLRYTITFDDAKDLKRGDRVQLGGVDIGVVKFVELHTQPTRVDVGVKIAPEHAKQVRADSTAIISSTSFPNVSGQKVLEIVNSSVEPPYPPMETGATIEGLDGKIDEGAWKLKKKLEGSKEDWKRRVDLIGDSVKQSIDQINELRESPQVREVMAQLKDFLAKMRDKGKGAVEELAKEWGPLKEKIQPILKQLTEWGRKYLADQLRHTMDQIDETIKSWRNPAAPDKPTPIQPAAPAEEVPGTNASVT